MALVVEWCFKNITHFILFWVSTSSLSPSLGYILSKIGGHGNDHHGGHGDIYIHCIIDQNNARNGEKLKFYHIPTLVIPFMISFMLWGTLLNLGL